MEKISLEDIKKSSVYITPNFPKLSTRRYKIGIFTVMSSIAVYSLMVILFTVALLIFTPLKSIPFIFENAELQKEQENIELLEQKIRLLTAEVNRISDLNKKLNYAIILGVDESIDTTNAIYDSLRSDTSSHIEGNIFAAFIKMIGTYFSDSTSSVYFISPVKGFIIKEYNEEIGHLGIDFGVTDGTPVVAAAGGYIVFAGRTFDDGNLIIVKHNDDYITIYKHCSVILKKTREAVLQGETIALSGNSGYNTSGPHLHFEIWKSGKALNPKNYLIN